MFLRIVDAYLIFKHSHQIANPFEVKVNTDFVASSVEVKTHIYMAFYPIWIKHSGVMLSLAPYYPQRKQNLEGNDEPG